MYLHSPYIKVDIVKIFLSYNWTINVSFLFLKSVEQLHKLSAYPQAMADIPPVVPLVGKHVDDPWVSLKHVTGPVFVSPVGECWGSDVFSSCHGIENLSHAAVTCRGCLVAAGQVQKTLPVTCCVNVYLLAHASEHMRVNACIFSFVLSRKWLILTCRILTECSAIPGGTRPQGRNNSLRFLLLSLFLHSPNLCPLSFHTSPPLSI